MCLSAARQRGYSLRVNPIVGSFTPPRPSRQRGAHQRRLCLLHFRKRFEKERRPRRNPASSRVAQCDGAAKTSLSEPANSAMPPRRASACVARIGTDGPRRSALSGRLRRRSHDRECRRLRTRRTVLLAGSAAGAQAGRMCSMPGYRCLECGYRSLQPLIARAACGVFGSKLWFTRKNRPGPTMRIGPGGESERVGSGKVGKLCVRMHLENLSAAMNWFAVAWAPPTAPGVSPAHVLRAATNAGDCGLIPVAVRLTPPPPPFGSGKLGTP